MKTTSKDPAEEPTIILYSPTQKCLHIQTVAEMLQDGRKILNGEMPADFTPVAMGLYPGVAQFKAQLIEFLYPELFQDGEEKLAPLTDEALKTILKQILLDFH